MHDPVLVRDVQALRDVDGDRCDDLRIDGPARDEIAQGDAVDVLHDQVAGLARAHAGVEHGDEGVVAQRSEEGRLRQRTLHGVDAVGGFAEHLHRHRALEVVSSAR